MVYLLHFSKPIGSSNPKGKAQHYLGYCSPRNLPDRLEAHASGEGAHIMRAVMQAGVDFELVRTWVGGRTLERQLKNRKKARQLCPYCRGK